MWIHLWVHLWIYLWKLYGYIMCTSVNISMETLWIHLGIHQWIQCGYIYVNSVDTSMDTSMHTLRIHLWKLFGYIYGWIHTVFTLSSCILSLQDSTHKYIHYPVHRFNNLALLRPEVSKTSPERRHVHILQSPEVLKSFFILFS